MEWKKEDMTTPWVNWKRIAVPKGLGGWGLKDIFLFSKATGMEINFGKYSLTTHLLRPEEEAEMSRIFPITIAGLDEGLKYLGFSLKANLYQKQDWFWLVGKVEK